MARREWSWIVPPDGKPRTPESAYRMYWVEDFHGSGLPVKHTTPQAAAAHYLAQRKDARRPIRVWALEKSLFPQGEPVYEM